MVSRGKLSTCFFEFKQQNWRQHCQGPAVSGLQRGVRRCPLAACGKQRGSKFQPFMFDIGFWGHFEVILLGFYGDEWDFNYYIGHGIGTQELWESGPWLAGKGKPAILRWISPWKKLPFIGDKNKKATFDFRVIPQISMISMNISIEWHSIEIFIEISSCLVSDQIEIWGTTLTMHQNWRYLRACDRLLTLHKKEYPLVN